MITPSASPLAERTRPSLRGAPLAVATAVLLGGPTLIAFFSGGYFEGPRVTAAAIAWALVFLLALLGPSPIPVGLPARLAVGGLAGLAAWSAVSAWWTPLVGAAFDSVQRILLYLGVLLAAIALLRDRRASRAVEPALALGALIVIGYGLAGRLLPGIVELGRSWGAGGRLEQPLTYWNAEGLLAAIGYVLATRVAGDPERPTPMRVAAAASCVPLGLGVYLSYSRGALAAAMIGLVVLVAAAPDRAQLRAAVVAVVFAVGACVCAAELSGVAALEGTASELERDGAIMTTVLVVLVLGAAAFTARAAQAERRSPALSGRLRFARRLTAVAVLAVGLGFISLIVSGLLENADRSEPAAASPSRLASVSSLRYEYWRVGGRAFASRPFGGHGAGSFQVVWRQEREVDAAVTEVHSIVLEMAAELGIVGLLLFGSFVAGVAMAGGRALRAGAAIAPGACAACIAWLLHAAIDWDWQVPAVTLPAVVLAAALLAQGRRTPPVLELTPEPELVRTPVRIS